MSLTGQRPTRPPVDSLKHLEDVIRVISAASSIKGMETRTQGEDHLDPGPVTDQGMKGLVQEQDRDTAQLEAGRDPYPGSPERKQRKS